MPLDPVETLQQLIAIPSVNPLGHEGAGEIYGEARLTDHLQGLCDRLGWRWLRQVVHPGRENLLALIPGSRPAREGGELQLWDVHQDTVAVEGMTVASFGGEVRDGRVYGRGACDDKGPMAAMIAALSRLDNLPSKLERPSVVLAFPVNEECGFTGATAMTELWNLQGQNSARITGGNITAAEMFPHPPDLAIVAEPTDLNVVVAHQGMARWRCHVTGRAAHSSRPDEGVNAIYAMAKVARAIEDYQQLLADRPPHPLCGRPAVCVTTITGGVGINTVPDHVTISIDRRVGPGDNPEAAFAELVRYVAEHVSLGRAEVKHDPPFMKSSGLADAANRPLAERLAELVEKSGRASKIVGAPYGTDAAAIGAAGVPTVVFGPGSVRQAHTEDEYIEIRVLELGTELYYRAASERLLSATK
jgi:acetylornithine deacetylase/succinyl-diaminopimelate desuccinylase-like protein